MPKTLKIITLILITYCFSASYVYAQVFSDTLATPSQVPVWDTLNTGVIGKDTIVKKPVKIRESRRVVAVLLCATLGPFGMHRLYLGTEPQVAAAYSATLGGGFGFVVVVDFFHLVFSKDISRFRNNPHFIMWKKP
ncbi:MAG: NINE protein [Flavobacteriales bacterium]